MKHVLVVGCGLSGLTCAIELAQNGIQVTLVSPAPSERAQSVMAAGGINAAIGKDDTPERHAEDTIRSGGNIAGRETVKGLCSAAPDILRWLETLGVVFSRNEFGGIALRAFGGQSRNRTAYAGASSGKQIMTALIREARKYECCEKINRKISRQFHSALIRDNKCYGALLYNVKERKIETVYADAVVIASGGQNVLFGKTTGSMQCDGYVAAKLYEQGARLKNLEFIQYHPTTVETPHKRMLISEAARGEGGRLYYLEGDRRVYFMEDKYGERGNLMPRDIVSKCIYDAPSQVYLDIAFLGKKRIASRLLEVSELCRKYVGLDVTKESIPVYPSVHFFMGGLAVGKDHKTSVDNLYAVGECASMYHGANRLGGNSMLAAIYGGKMAAKAIDNLPENKDRPDFSEYIAEQERALDRQRASQSRFSAVYVRMEIAKLLNDCLGITRTEENLLEGIRSVDFYLSVSEKLICDSDISLYIGYSLRPMLLLARAILTCALERRETRGAHIREDYPESCSEFALCTVCDYQNGEHRVSYVKEDEL
ncbi:MAG: FAD-dependent oxidoreductase [Christensenellales bacterium]|nr:FAD-dependent oxidoreductase [Christensenellales bacterium]